MRNACCNAILTSFFTEFSLRQSLNVTGQRHIQFVVYFSTTASQKVKFCKIKSVTRDKKHAKNAGMVSSVSDFVILTVVY